MATAILNRLFASGVFGNKFGNKGMTPPTPTPVSPVGDFGGKRKKVPPDAMPLHLPTSVPKPPKGSTLLTAGAGAPAVRNTLLGQ